MIRRPAVQLVLAFVAVLAVGAVAVALAQGDEEPKPESIDQVDAAPASESCPKADAIMFGPYPVSSFVQHCPSHEELVAIFAYVDADGFDIDELRQGCIEDLAFTGPCRDVEAAITSAEDASPAPAPGDAPMTAPAPPPLIAGDASKGGRVPTGLNPVEAPNRIGQISDSRRAECEAGEGDRLLCLIIDAVDQGIIEEGQQLSNPELQDALETVAPPRGEVCDDSGRCAPAIDYVPTP